MPVSYTHLDVYKRQNVDFADVKSVMTDRGIAHMGTGKGHGENRAKDAVKSAIESPMLETTIEGAKAILLYVSGGYDLGMLEVSEIAGMVEEQADRDCILIFGAAVNEEMEDEIAITVIATGFGEGLEKEEEPQQTPSRGLSQENPKKEEPKAVEEDVAVSYTHLDVYKRQALAIAAGELIGIDPKEAAKGLALAELTGKRLKVTETENLKVIDDTYNACEDSIKSAIDTLAATSGDRHVAILGDIIGLADKAEKSHRAVGRYAAEKGTDLLIAVGREAVYLSLIHIYKIKSLLKVSIRK